MKQKLKEKFNVGDKVKKSTFTKCVKMSKEVENLKNGILNGESLINIQHQQQKQSKLGNSNVDRDTKSIVGGRLQFYKDGKFILELARAREGEKTGWISVPRKTFWPPTISTNSSTTFNSDDNSSIQSSPWQRDHCWKQTQPRNNISKEMVLFFHRPGRLRLSKECQKTAQSKRRRPLDKGGNVKFIQIDEKKDDLISDDISNDAHSKSDDDNKINGDSKLEKVSLEDTKRSRPKASLNGNNSTIPLSSSSSSSSSISPQMSNGNLTTKNQQQDKSTPPVVSRPISSYSITSLLAHNNNNSSTSAAAGSCYSINEHSNDSTSTSHYQQQRLSLSQNSSPKSPLQQQQQQQQKSSSPNQSPSPEHHAFHKYRPTTTPTAASSSPFSGSYHSPNYIRGSPSPHADNRLRTTGNYHHQHSPSHYASSPSHQSFGTPRDSSLSPNVERTSTASSRSTPTSSGTSGIRTVPKKTAALRQQFSSPTMEISSKKSSTMKAENVDSLLRPSALIAPPVPHPAQMYPYMYPTLSYLPTAVPPYYHPAFYNPAMMAAAAASYRIPGMHPGAIPGYPGASLSPVSTAQLAGSSSPVSGYEKNSNGQRNSTISSPPATHPTLSPYVPSSPWNPIPLTNHSINDGSIIPKAKDEPISDVPLNLSKH
ncbi:CLUMA_CG008369, isoform A [Clunio marinus]|uniref:CLUMA_CG008369, isoform A n=1 Tax=Clunio marinus TaxID=568069 RepID=A0A1J1I3K5_9DIPT|nr:CLUMA_CG008369, isoform A [Clunio marinus]